MENNTKYPLVSIGIPTYNGSTRIHKSLTSIWEQNYPNLEVIISDNCSTDNSAEVINEICKDHHEIKYFRQSTNIGPPMNFNFVLEKASGKYFMWLSDDDKLEPGALSRYVAFLENNKDYSLASGKIQYWTDNTLDIVEEGFTFEQNSPAIRVIRFYFKVVYCGMIHGMMRRELAKGVSFRKVFGNDFHFMANLAFLGKVKNFDFVGYNKTFGGTSSNPKRYARLVGESKLVGYFPRVKMAGDAFAEVMHLSPVFSHVPVFSKFVLAISSLSGVLYCHYIKIVIGSRIRNFIRNPFYILDRLGLKAGSRGEPS